MCITLGFPGLEILGKDRRTVYKLSKVCSQSLLIHGILFFLYGSALIWRFVEQVMDLARMMYRCIYQEMSGWDLKRASGWVGGCQRNLKMRFKSVGEIDPMLHIPTNTLLTISFCQLGENENWNLWFLFPFLCLLMKLRLLSYWPFIFLLFWNIWFCPLLILGGYVFFFLIDFFFRNFLYILDIIMKLRKFPVVPCLFTF